MSSYYIVTGYESIFISAFQKRDSYHRNVAHIRCNRTYGLEFTSDLMETYRCV